MGCLVPLSLVYLAGPSGQLKTEHMVSASQGSKSQRALQCQPVSSRTHYIQPCLFVQ